MLQTALRHAPCIAIFAVSAWTIPVAPATSAVGASETDGVVRTTAAEFMKGFGVIDSDGDDSVDLTAMVRMLRSIGYGKAETVRRGRGGGADPFELFESREADGDGILSADEAGPYMRQTEYFKDGEATLEEFQKAWAELQSQRGGGRGTGRGRGRGGSGSVQTADLEFVTTLDANRDGTLTAAEAREAIRADVVEAMDNRTSLDANGDGWVEPREYALSQPKTGRPVDENGLDGHARGHFEREDYDRDGTISVAEIAERVAVTKMRRFRAMQLGLRLAQIDADSDGHLSATELEASGGTALRQSLEVSEDGPLELAQLYGRIYGASPEYALAVEDALRRN